MGTEYKKVEMNTPILNFYNRKSILITGTTGFLGSALLEKILYSCSNVKNVYALVKSKKGLSGQERLKNLFDCEGFQRVTHQLDLLNKVVAVEGDLVEDGLGLSHEDMTMLQREVNVVFHVAANINFDGPFVDIINVNTRATRKMLQLGRTMHNLQAFVYVSTAYSNCTKNNKIVEEKVYNTLDLEAMSYAIDNYSNSPLIHNIVERWPNKYTFSKYLSEQIIENEFPDMPVAIVRPSIVLGAVKEPVEGWVRGGSSGAISVAVLEGKSHIRVWQGTVDAIVDVIPIDYVANFLIASAWDVSRNNVQAKTKVFNFCSGIQNPLTMKGYLSKSSYHSRKHYKRDFFIPPYHVMIKNNILFSVLFFLLQTIPAYIIQGISSIFGRKSRMLNLHRKICKLQRSVRFFNVNQFIFIDRNVRQLQEDMTGDDRLTFSFDVKDIQWDSYMEKFVIGTRKYLLKE